MEINIAVGRGVTVETGHNDEFPLAIVGNWERQTVLNQVSDWEIAV